MTLGKQVRNANHSAGIFSGVLFLQQLITTKLTAAASKLAGFHYSIFAVASIAFFLPCEASGQTSLNLIAGKWVNESGYQINLVPNNLGGWDILTGNQNGQGSITLDGSYGGNVRVDYLNAICNYRISVIMGAMRMQWQRLAGSSSCLHGYFDKLESAEIKIDDVDIEMRNLKYDYMTADRSYGYQTFVYERPIYSYVDTPAGRVPVYIAACAAADCNPEVAQRLFCQIMRLKPASLPEDAISSVQNLSEKTAWVWDLNLGKSIRDLAKSRNLFYFNKVTCRK